MDEADRAGYFREKAHEYRAKALKTADPNVKRTLEAVAREYSRRAEAVDRESGTKPGLQGAPRSKTEEL
jgi:hypothetical protein